MNPAGPGPLASALLRRRWLRVLLVVLAFPVPLTNLVSGTIVVLGVRALGWREGAIDALLATAILTALLLTGQGAWLLPVVAAGAYFGGCVLAAELWNRTGAPNLPLQVLVLLGWAAVLMAAWWLPDPAAFWTPVLRELLTEALRAPAGITDTALELTARMMNGLLAASTVLSVAIALLFGSWLAQPGPDGTSLDLQRLQMGKVIGVATLLAALALLAGSRVVAGGCLLVGAVAFALQGLAVVHWTARVRHWPRMWPLAVYLPLFLSPTVAAAELGVLALFGFVDNWFGLRPGLARSADENVIK